MENWKRTEGDGSNNSLIRANQEQSKWDGMSDAEEALSVNDGYRDCHWEYGNMQNQDQHCLSRWGKLNTDKPSEFSAKA